MSGRERRKSREAPGQRRPSASGASPSPRGQSRRPSGGVGVGGGGGGRRASGNRTGGGRQRSRTRESSRLGGVESGANFTELSKRCVAWGSTVTAASVMAEWAALGADAFPADKTTKAADAAPQRKKRYRTVCWDHSRVKLESGEFIHANYVSGEMGRKFILTQGPTEETIGDFWGMVWQEKAPVIVMLCQLVEDGKPKCAAYYKEKKGETLEVTLSGGRLKVTTEALENVGEIKSQDIRHLTLKLNFKGSLHVVHHYQYRSWPDQDVPSSCEAMVPFVRRVGEKVEELVKAQRTTTDKPMLVHCSAGIGRSGTIVALDGLWRLLMDASAPQPSLPALLRSIRADRHGAVQTPAQYFFIYQALITYLKERRLLSISPPAMP